MNLENTMIRKSQSLGHILIPVTWNARIGKLIDRKSDCQGREREGRGQNGVPADGHGVSLSWVMNIPQLATAAQCWTWFKKPTELNTLKVYSIDEFSIVNYVSIKNKKDVKGIREVPCRLQLLTNSFLWKGQLKFRVIYSVSDGAGYL